MFRQYWCFLVSAPHQTGAKNSTHTRPRPDRTRRIAAGTSLEGKATRTATTRANPHHLARLFLLFDMAHLGRALRPEMRSIQAYVFVGCQRRKLRPKTGFSNRGEITSGTSRVLGKGFLFDRASSSRVWKPSIERWSSACRQSRIRSSHREVRRRVRVGSRRFQRRHHQTPLLDFLTSCHVSH